MKRHKLTETNKTIFIGISTIIILQFGFSVKLFAQKQEDFPKDHLQKTKLLSESEVESLPSRMLEGTKKYFRQEADSSVQRRKKFWNINYQSRKAYLNSIASNREEFKEIIGLVDDRENVEKLTFIENTTQKALIAKNENYSIYQVRWQVLEGVSGVGLLLEPHGKVHSQIIAIPDADWTPEMLCGLTPGVPPEAQFAKKLAAGGNRVVVPFLINRSDTWSGNPDVSMTNETHREFIYRRAYEMGRHIIGYEVQKILGLVDYFTHNNFINHTDTPIAVAGYGEGGLLAFYSAAVDPRIKGALVSGYFQKREELWKEPIYRNIWGLLRRFGDAEIASLIAPRALIIEASEGPEVEGPPVPDGKQQDVAAPGSLTSPPLHSVIEESEKAKKIFDNLHVPKKIQVVVNENGRGSPGSTKALKAFLKGIDVKPYIPNVLSKHLSIGLSEFDLANRSHDQIQEIQHHLDEIIKQSSIERKKYWKNADSSSVEKWSKSTEAYRNYFWKEIIGKMPPPSESINPRTRLAYETSKWKGYWVELDVWPNITTGGILLIPNDLQKKEQRPLVVTEHGLGGTPQEVIDPHIKSVYNSFGAQLADEGFVVYAPQSIYGLMPNQTYGNRSFREIQRMANPLKESIFSVIIGQEQQTLKWLKKLPFVDGEHIGLYGLSYGGKAAMRIPAVLKDYSVVISSGDFNQWVWKTTSLNFTQSYMFLPEYDMYEFNLGNKFNYAEMAGLIAPRPFMVERGHYDPVAPDEWIGYEYAKVQRLYDLLDIGDRTRIEFFNGPHQINGVGTFEFLRRHLWPTKTKVNKP